MKLAQYRSQLRFRLQEPQDTGRFSDGELDSYINRAQREVCDKIEPLVAAETLAFLQGDAAQALPLDLLRIHRAFVGATRLRTTDPIVLDTVSLSWETAEGTPTHFFIDGNDLRLYPIPDAPVNVSLRYANLPADLSEDNDESPLPNWMDEGIFLYALTLARDADENERANNDFQKWERWLQLALSRMRTRSVNPLLRMGAGRGQ